MTTEASHQPGSDSTAFAFIDASNLFYGGEKNLGWRIDYEKLLTYLKTKYSVTRTLFFGGVETHDFAHNYLVSSTVDLTALSAHLDQLIHNEAGKLNEAQLLLLGRHLQRIKFYRKLAYFGYELYLKPVKLYDQEDGTTRRKANCDVEMAFELMRQKDHFGQLVFCSGDGDFLPVLKYLRSEGKQITVLARGPRTAREIRQFAGPDFRDFVTLRDQLEFTP